jgi:ABC-type multidrug transport system fused ATPase/permease subunit
MNLPLRQYWELLAQHIRPQRGRFMLLSALMLTNIGLQVASPQIMRFFLDTALAGGALSQLSAAAGAFLAAALMMQALSVAVNYVSENVAWTATNSLRAELTRHVLNLDMSFHNQHTPGELIERIDGDVTELATFFSQFVVTLLGSVLLLVGILAALFVADWRAGTAFTIFAAFSLVALNRVRDIAVQHQKDFRQACADMYGFIEEQLGATEDIRSSGAEGYAIQQIYRLQSSIQLHDFRTGWKTWLIDNVTTVMLALGLILAVTSGYLLYSAALITIGTVYLFVHYITLLEQPLSTLTHQIQSFQTIGACVDRLTELRKIQPKVQEATQPVRVRGGKPCALPGRRALSGGPLTFAFEGVTFSYNAENTILRDVSFRLEPGSVLGLLGRTGSGKTTLTRLAFRLYDPTSGKVLANGHDLRQVSLRALRRRVGVVTQDVQLFRATVRDNLTFFDQHIPDRRITGVLEELELGDWLRSLPNGLNSEMQNSGHNLSAGEAQLLAFARIFLREPGLVILDEASSRLDPATEQRIERAVDRLISGRTAIIVAHRLHTVQRATEVMILEDGRIGEYGERAYLAADPNSRFAQLLQTGLGEVLV